MTAICFVDANVLVYAVGRSEPQKRQIANAWLTQLWTAGAGRTGTQVLNEFYVIATARLRQRVTATAARLVIEQYFAWQPVAIDRSLIAAGWGIQDRFRFSSWDSLIVAAAQKATCKFLLTEDLQHLQNLDGLVVLNPFKAELQDFLN